jgi:hypothetical protein
MLRSRLVFDRLTNFPLSGIDTVIPLDPKIRQSIKSLSDLTHQLVQLPGQPEPAPPASALLLTALSRSTINGSDSAVSFHQRHKSANK